MAMEYRLATLDDLEAIKRLHNANTNWLGFVPLVAQKTIVEAKGAWVAQADDTSVVGYVTTQYVRKYKQRVIRQLAVDDTYRKQGIGRGLVACVPKPCMLYVDSKNPACQFYERLGFIRMGTKQGKKTIIAIYQYL